MQFRLVLFFRPLRFSKTSLFRINVKTNYRQIIQSGTVFVLNRKQYIIICTNETSTKLRKLFLGIHFVHFIQNIGDQILNIVFFVFHYSYFFFTDFPAYAPKQFFAATP